MASRLPEAVAILRRRGPSRFVEIRAELGSPDRATFSRWLRAGAGAVVSFGQKRTGVFYAVPRQLERVGSRWPIHVVGHDGVPEALGELLAVEPRGFVVVAAQSMPRWMHGEHGHGMFDGVPFFLGDARPQGYLGRSLARRLAAEIGVPERLSDWQERHVVAALTLAGDDNPGAMLVGVGPYEHHMRRLLAAPPRPLAGDLATTYEQLASDTLAGEVPGSSAAGEQPKFTAFAGADAPRHVLVKFSPERDGDVAERWADLLVCEHLAHEVARAAGIATVSSRIIDGAHRRFLEVERFDRIGALGRRAALSLLAVDAEYFGELDTWPEASRRLLARRWLSPVDADTLLFLWLFSGLIANADRHFGNITLLPEADGFRLAPMYDVLPMLFAPQAGELIERAYEPPAPAVGQIVSWRRAARAGVAFWDAVASDPRITRGFRDRAADCALTITRALARLG